MSKREIKGNVVCGETKKVGSNTKEEDKIGFGKGERRLNGEDKRHGRNLST